MVEIIKASNVIGDLRSTRAFWVKRETYMYQTCLVALLIIAGNYRNWKTCLVYNVHNKLYMENVAVRLSNYNIAWWN